MIKKLFSLTNIFGVKDTLKFLFVIFFSIISSFFEVIGIGVLTVFTLFLSDPNIYLEKIFITDLQFFLKQFSRIDLIIFISIFILIIFLIKHFIVFLTGLFEIKVTKKITLHLKEKIFKYYLSNEYENFLEKNKSDFINIISSQTSSFMGYVHNVFLILKELILIIFIFMSMLIVNWEIILALTFLLSIFSYLFINIFKKKLNDIGEQSRNLQEQEIRHIDETYQSFRIIKLEGRQNLFLSILKSIIQKKNYYEIIHFIIGKIPKIYLELLILIFFLGTVLFLIIKDPNNFEILGTITFFAISIIRMMPAFITLNNAFASLVFFRPSFETIYKMINNIDKKKIFNHEKDNKFTSKLEEINISNLNFSYKNSKKINLDNINITIKKNDILGIIGPSGSGKSTLLHLMIGLLKPNFGKILINKKSVKNNEIYRNYKISYIPQDSVIFNRNLSDNIAFGEKNIDEKKIKESINFANLNDFITKHQEKIETGFGDNGSKLSHGQKQRIGLARAYYTNSDLIIFDESLNALDRKNESIIIKNILKLKNKILIIVAHKTETLRYCNKLLILRDCEVVDFGTKDEILARHGNLEKYLNLNNEEN